MPLHQALHVGRLDTLGECSCLYCYLHTGLCTSWSIVWRPYCRCDCRPLGEKVSPLACRGALPGWVPDGCPSPSDRGLRCFQGCATHWEAANWCGLGMVLPCCACERTLCHKHSTLCLVHNQVVIAAMVEITAPHGIAMD